MPVVAAVVIGAVAAGAFFAHQAPPSGSGSDNQNTVSTQNQQQNGFNLTPADVDQSTTEKAISELRSGTPEPMLAALPDSVKQEILSGERKFYNIPLQSPAGQNAYQSGDKINVDFNGSHYGTYDLSQPVTLDMPLKMGDEVVVTCLSVAEGKSSVVVNMATILNPVSSNPLAPGQSQRFSVHHGADAQNFQWFEQQAESGNPVAEYGLGHMYEYGMGVGQDRNQAIHWYQQAAAQNYLDAAGQVQQLESGS